MIKAAPHVIWFKDIDKDDVALVGGKGANLGEMYKAKIPVPNGFCVTAEAFHYFMNANELKLPIADIIQDLDVNDNDQLFAASSKIKQLIKRKPLPEDLEQEILRSYAKFPVKNQEVAVRSSATAEDLPDASFAGQQATFLNIAGDEALLKAIRGCFASLYEARAIFYRTQKGYDHFQVKIAVPVQAMVQSEVSGVMFTVNPVNNDPYVIVIESVWGLGEMIVQGSVTPDHFEVDKERWTIRNKEISPQQVQLTKYKGTTKTVKVPQTKAKAQKVSDEIVIKIAKLGQKLQEHYGRPQDIEWAYEKGKIYIVQTRPITTIDAVEAKTDRSIGEVASIVGSTPKPILTGAAASPGIATGKARILNSPKDNEKVKAGDILVAPMTTPDYVPAMKRAAAIVTDKGGQTSHAAIVSRELGVPCVVGTGTATRDIKNGQLITVDAQVGQIFKGEMEIKRHSLSLPKGVDSIRELKTKTKVYVNLGEPDLAGGVAQKYVDGVGLLRAEFIISEYIGAHPLKLLAEGNKRFFINKLAEGLEDFCRSFGERPVIYRTTDFKTNEYRGLPGGEKYEPEEANPMIGFRGCHRYIKGDQVFLMELEAIKKVRQKMGYANLHVMIPFVRTVKHLAEVKHLMAINGLQRRSNFKLYMMVEIPNNVFLLDEFIDEGIDGISIGSNDLTMLILGCDRDNEMVAEVYDELDPGVLKALEIIVRTAKRRGVDCSICGQAPSMYPELTEKLVSWGATSVSVSPDMIDKTRLIVHQAEGRLKSKPVTKKDQKRKETLTLFQRLFRN